MRQKQVAGHFVEPHTDKNELSKIYKLEYHSGRTTYTNKCILIGRLFQKIVDNFKIENILEKSVARIRTCDTLIIIPMLYLWAMEASCKIGRKIIYLFISDNFQLKILIFRVF